MAERKRNKDIHFYVTDEERKLIRQKMLFSQTRNMELIFARWLSTAISSIPICPQLRKCMKKCKIGLNINQIAKKVNTTGELYPKEIEELKKMVEKLWEILRNFSIEIE